MDITAREAAKGVFDITDKDLDALAPQFQELIMTLAFILDEMVDPKILERIRPKCHSIFKSYAEATELGIKPTTLAHMWILERLRERGHNR